MCTALLYMRCTAPHVKKRSSKDSAVLAWTRTVDQSLVLSRLTMQGPAGRLFRASFRRSRGAAGTVVRLFLSIDPSEAASSAHDEMVVTAMWFLCAASEDPPVEVVGDAAGDRPRHGHAGQRRASRLPGVPRAGELSVPHHYPPPECGAGGLGRPAAAAGCVRLPAQRHHRHVASLRGTALVPGGVQYLVKG